MKKIVSLILALALVMSMSITAFATENTGTLTDTSNNKEITVTGTYNAGGSAANKVSVTITWENMSFTYNAASQGEWNPTSHTYTGSTTAGWAESSNKITVTNHSNVDVNATFTFAKANAVTTELTGSFSGTSTVGKAAITNGTVKLNAGVVNEVDNADKVEAKLALTGSLPENWTADNTIGTVTVAIATVAATN